MGFLGRTAEALREFGQNWAARRAGRRHVPNDIRRQARDVAGVTGWMYSKGWDELAKVEPSYLRSFETPRVPPSLHISERDRRRAGLAVPLAERCIEDHGKPEAERPGAWSTAELTADRGDRGHGLRRRPAPPGARPPKSDR